MAKVLYPYTAQNAEELTIAQGEEVAVIQSDPAKQWWKVRNAAGRTGFVPSTYLKATSAPKGGPSGAGSGGGSAKVVVYAKYPYEACLQDELSFSAGSEIVVLERRDDGWCRGQCDGRIGLFPENYVGDIPDSIPTVTVRPAAVPAPVEAKDTGKATHARVKFAFTAHTSNELSVAVGDVVKITDRKGDWWKVERISDGKTGLVPFSYLEVGVAVGADYVLAAAARKQSSGNAAVAAPAAAAAPALVPKAGALKAQSVASLQNNSVDLVLQPYFHGQIPRLLCEKLVADRGRIGDFLVRESERTKGDYSVTLHIGTQVKHFKITQDGDSWQIGDRKFSTIPELVTYYKTNPLFTNARDEKVRLLNPFEIEYNDSHDYSKLWESVTNK